MDVATCFPRRKLGSCWKGSRTFVSAIHQEILDVIPWNCLRCAASLLHIEILLFFCVHLSILHVIFPFLGSFLFRWLLLLLAPHNASTLEEEVRHSFQALGWGRSLRVVGISQLFTRNGDDLALAILATGSNVESVPQRILTTAKVFLLFCVPPGVLNSSGSPLDFRPCLRGPATQTGCQTEQLFSTQLNKSI